MTGTDLSAWIGREEIRRELIAREPFLRLDALLDRAPDPDAASLPPLGHWLLFLPDAPQAEIGPDGHPARGGFYPPIPLPMRMWAGSRLVFEAPIPFGALAVRTARIRDIRQKDGRTGPLAFVTVDSEVSVDGRVCVREQQDVVFRDRSGQGAPAPAGERRASEASRSIEPTAALLFRFSALTFNAHRIHYDRDYAMQVEGYPGLVVHGPLLATLLMDHYRRQRPGVAIRTFTFRAQRPVHDLAPFTVNMRSEPGGASLWAADTDGYVAMDARIEAED
jgi:3-methylfumaryl-CoA hydratase